MRLTDDMRPLQETCAQQWKKLQEIEDLRLEYADLCKTNWYQLGATSTAQHIKVGGYYIVQYMRDE